MANKKVSVRIEVEREQQYIESLKKINAQNKTLATELSKISAQYAENANSYDALSKKSEALGKAYDKQSEKLNTLRAALANIEKRRQQDITASDALKKKVEETANAYKNAAEKTDNLKKAMDSASAAYRKNGEDIEYCDRRIESYTQEINKAEAAQATLSREIEKTNGYLAEARDSIDKTAKSIDQYGKKVDDAGNETEGFATSAEALATAIVASGISEAAGDLKDTIIDIAQASIEFESAFAGVKKTVDGTDEELEELSDGIKELATEIPLTTTELAKIAETAGQLGVAKGDILTFTEVVANLAVATDLSAEEAAVSLARIANITGLMTSEYDNFGSTLVDLGNNSAAFESEILEMTTRLAGTGSIVEATDAQLLGIATTLVSLGIEAEAGGTAFSKLLTNIELAVETGADELQQYADVAGMSVKQFSDAWRNDAVGAVSAFVDGLGGLKSEGQSAIVVLDDMGISEVRLRDVILKLTEADGLLSENLNRANTAWSENNALTAEAEKRYETTESKMTLAKTAIDNFKITIGDELLEQFGGFIGKFTDLVTECDKFLRKNPDVITGINALKKALGINDELNAVGDAADDLVGKLQELKKEYAETADAAEKMSVLSEAESTYKKLSEAIDDYDTKLAESKERLSDLREEQKKLLETQNETYAQELKAAEQAASLQLQIDAELKNIQTYISARNALGNQRRQTAEDLAVWREECSAAADAVEEVATTTTEVGKEVATTGDIIEETAKKATTSTKATKEAIDEAGQSIIDHAKIVQTNLNTLTKEYDSAYKSAQSSLGGIGGLFGEISFKADKSIDSMISGMQSQADYFTGYMQNLQRAADIGLSEGLVASLADGSDASAGYLQKIINEFNTLVLSADGGSEKAQEFIDNFNAAFEASSAAKDALAQTMAGITTDFDARKSEILTSAKELISELNGYSGESLEKVREAVIEAATAVTESFDDINTAIAQRSEAAVSAMNKLRGGADAALDNTEETGKAAGENYAEGMAEGITNGTGAVVNAASTMAISADKAVRDTLKIHSPSKVAEQDGEFFDEGFAKGIKDNTYTVIDGTLYMIDALTGEARKAAEDAGVSLGESMSAAMAQELGESIRKMAADGTLTYNGASVGTAASAGIPNLSGDAATNWNAALKKKYGLPESWTNQQITDWLNVGGFMASSGAGASAATAEGTSSSALVVKTPAQFEWRGSSRASTTLQKALRELSESEADKMIDDLVAQMGKQGFDVDTASASAAIGEAAEDYFRAAMREIKAAAAAAGETLSAEDLLSRVLDAGTSDAALSEIGQKAGEIYINSCGISVLEASPELSGALNDTIAGIEAATTPTAATAGANIGSAMTDAMIVTMSAGISKALDVANAQTRTHSSSNSAGASVNVTQNFNVPVVSPHQMQVQAQRSMREALYS